MPSVFPLIKTICVSSLISNIKEFEKDNFIASIICDNSALDNVTCIIEVYFTLPELHLECH